MMKYGYEASRSGPSAEHAGVAHRPAEERDPLAQNPYAAWSGGREDCTMSVDSLEKAKAKQQAQLPASAAQPASDKPFRAVVGRVCHNVVAHTICREKIV